MGFHSRQPDAGIYAGVHRAFHEVFMHQAVVVSHHNPVDPTEVGRPQQTVFHVAVGTEAEKPDPAFRLFLFGPRFGRLIHFVNAANAVHKEKINIIGLHSFQRLI